MLKTLATLIATTLLSLPVIAQTTLVDFDTLMPKHIGVYDYWEDSPFNKGLLKGHAQIVPNPAPCALNASNNALAIQRSRYGSNVFGAKIVLDKPLRLSPTMQYIHVLMHRPITGRVMLVGLGQRYPERQSVDVPQCFVTATPTAAVNEWQDVVFGVKGHQDILIHSLVLVPHLESPHHLDRDFIAYIDHVICDTTARPRQVAAQQAVATASDANAAILAQHGLTKIAAAPRNGDIVLADGTPLPQQAAANKPLVIRLVPEHGFVAGDIKVVYGTNIFSSTSPQRHTATIKAKAGQHLYTIPAQYMADEISLVVEFVEKK